MNDSAGLYVGRPVPSGLIAASATPATVFTLDAASFTALFAAVCCQQELPTFLPVTFCSDAPRERSRNSCCPPVHLLRDQARA